MYCFTFLIKYVLYQVRRDLTILCRVFDVTGERRCLLTKLTEVTLVFFANMLQENSSGLPGRLLRGWRERLCSSLVPTLELAKRQRSILQREVGQIDR